MQYIEMLRKEHDLITEAVKLANRVKNDLESGKEVDSDELLSIDDFFTHFADGVHHRKEEQIMFKALLNVSKSHEFDNDVSVLTKQHGEARDILRRLNGMTKKYVGGDKSVKEDLMIVIGELATMYSKHVDKENGIFFDEAPLVIDESNNRKITDEMNEFDHMYIINLFRSTLGFDEKK
jgi:hemerythrin-like domain-containing protein